MKFSMGCASFSYRCASDARACEVELGAGAEACKATCCSTSECNVSFPELNGVSGLVFGFTSMIVSVIVAFTLL
jgi:hypothetical protein